MKEWVNTTIYITLVYNTVFSTKTSALFPLMEEEFVTAKSSIEAILNVFAEFGLYLDCVCSIFII